MAQFVAFQSTYTHLQIALFNDEQSIAFVSIDKTQASKDCIIVLENLLRDHHLNFQDLSFIAANQGPGPFTTLRVAVATINGLSFASKIPLIGINGMQAFLQEYADQPYANKVVLLNAFGNDVYYGMRINNIYENIGCGQVESIMLEITQKMPEGSILFIGNGASQHASLISAALGNRAHFLNPNPATVSLAQIGKMAFAQWKSGHAVSYELQPLYFKSAI